GRATESPAWRRNQTLTSVQPDPSQVRRCRWGTLEFERKPVEIAPTPVLARLVPPYNRVPGQAEVRGRVPPRRVVTASDVIAFLAGPQMHPVPASLSQAVLATPE